MCIIIETSGYRTIFSEAISMSFKSLRAVYRPKQHQRQQPKLNSTRCRVMASTGAAWLPRMVLSLPCVWVTEKPMVSSHTLSVRACHALVVQEAPRIGDPWASLSGRATTTSSACQAFFTRPDISLNSATRKRYNVCLNYMCSSPKRKTTKQIFIIIIVMYFYQVHSHKLNIITQRKFNCISLHMLCSIVWHSPSARMGAVHRGSAWACFG